jgi:hypothetical protein
LQIGAPRTYEVSTPIASQLAYSEHKISYQPQQNAIQYSQPIQYNQKLPNFKQANFARPINIPQYQQQLFVQPQPLAYSQQPQSVVAPQLYQQLPRVSLPVHRPVQYIQNLEPQQQSTFSQEQQNLVQIFPTQPGVIYSQEGENNAQPNEQQDQRQSKLEEQRGELKISEKQTSPSLPPPEEVSYYILR